MIVLESVKKNVKDQYDWRDISFPTGPKDCKKFKTNNRTIALNVLLAPQKRKRKTNLHLKTQFSE